MSVMSWGKKMIVISKQEWNPDLIKSNDETISKKMYPRVIDN